MDELYHYGIRGMKWGVRRYQNEDGSWTEEGKKRRGYRDRVISANKTKKDVDDIIKTFNKKERDRLALDPGEEYLTFEQGSQLAKRIVEKNGDIPVSFIDFLEDGKNLNVALGTRSGDEYRGKGYATRATAKGMKWLDKHIDEYDKVIWGVRTDNEASIKIAKKFGFEEDPTSYSDDGKWVNYERTKAKSLAGDISKAAKKEEPKITNDVISAARSVGSKMYGLENKLKTEESLTRKIKTDAAEKGISESEAAKSIKDSVRYTTITNDNNFVKNYNSVKSSLEAKGYEETRCRNYWDMYSRGEVKHKSVQSVFKTPSGYEFEIQFQTPSSQAAKDKKVPIYEERRQLGISKERAYELETQMAKLAESVSDPKDIYKIKSH